jgi:hypothetical protein
MENAYWGLAAMSIVSDKLKDGGCGNLNIIFFIICYNFKLRSTILFRKY